MFYEGYLRLRRNLKRYDGKRGHVCSGFHNHLFWNNLLVGSTMLQNAAGPVYTIGIFRGKRDRSLDFERSETGEIVSPLARGHRHPVPIIHQWDHHLCNMCFRSSTWLQRVSISQHFRRAYWMGALVANTNESSKVCAWLIDVYMSLFKLPEWLEHSTVVKVHYRHWIFMMLFVSKLLNTHVLNFYSYFNSLMYL